MNNLPAPARYLPDITLPPCLTGDDLFARVLAGAQEFARDGIVPWSFTGRESAVDHIALESALLQLDETIDNHHPAVHYFIDAMRCVLDESIHNEMSIPKRSKYADAGDREIIQKARELGWKKYPPEREGVGPFWMHDDNDTIVLGLDGFRELFEEQEFYNDWLPRKMKLSADGMARIYPYEFFAMGMALKQEYLDAPETHGIPKPLPGPIFGMETFVKSVVDFDGDGNPRGWRLRALFRRMRLNQSLDIHGIRYTYAPE